MKGSVLRPRRDYGWEVPDPNGAGHTYFAAIASGRCRWSLRASPRQTVSFYDGETLA